MHYVGFELTGLPPGSQQSTMFSKKQQIPITSTKAQTRHSYAQKPIHEARELKQGAWTSKERKPRFGLRV